MTKIIITLPKNCQVKVEKNQKVEKGQQLAVKKGKKKDFQLNISKALKIPPKKSKNYLLCALGSKIDKKDLIAQKKGLFLFRRKKTVKSEFSGVLEEINLETGILKIVRKEKDIVIKSPFSAKVINLKKDEITLQAQAKIIKIKKIIGPSVYGILTTFANSKPSSVLEINHFDKAIVLFEKAPFSVIKKTIVMGAKALIFLQDNFSEELENKLTAFFKKRKKEITIALVDKEVFKNLQENVENSIYLDSKNKFLAVLNE